MGFLRWITGDDYYEVGYDIGKALSETELTEVTGHQIRQIAENSGYEVSNREQFEELIEGVEGSFTERRSLFSWLMGA